MERDDGKLNWALILNIALLAIVVIGAWFTTFSNPLNEKFVTLEKSFQAQIVANEKIQALSTAALERINREIETSVDRRFVAQDKANAEIMAEVNRIKDESERRRLEVATKIDLQDRLATTRLEFLSEIKRIDDIAAKAVSKEAFEVWRVQRNIMTDELHKQIDELGRLVFQHEKADRAYDKLIPPHILPKE